MRVQLVSYWLKRTLKSLWRFCGAHFRYNIQDHTESKTNLFSRNYKEFDVWKCEFCEKWVIEIVNFVKNEILKMGIFCKMRLWDCEFCENWDFENVNFVKSETLKMWILSKMIFSKCEFLDKLRIFAPVWKKWKLLWRFSSSQSCSSRRPPMCLASDRPQRLWAD